MKLKINQDMKRVITLYDMAAVDVLQKGFADQKNLDEEYRMLANFVCCSGAEILKKDHTICKNSRAWNIFGNNECGSETLDVMLEITVFDRWTDAFYQITACLSDVWQVGGTDADELKSHMYIRKYTVK